MPVRGSATPGNAGLNSLNEKPWEAARSYCLAVRSALTDDGRPPLAASGLKLKGRLEAIADSLDRVEQARAPEAKGG